MGSSTRRANYDCRMIKHPIDQGDGVEMFVAHQLNNISEVLRIHNSESKFELNDIEVKTGDTIDFVVDSGPTVGHDSFEMTARIRYVRSSPSQPSILPQSVSEGSPTSSAPLAPPSGPEANQDIAPLARLRGVGLGVRG